MNEQAASLLQALASRLDTTTQHLWGVLVKQAPINSAVSLLQYGLVALSCYGLFKLCQMTNKKVQNNEWDEFVWAGAAFASLIVAILVVTVLFDLPNMVAGFVNPEYWALHEILSAIGKK